MLEITFRRTVAWVTEKERPQRASCGLETDNLRTGQGSFSSSATVTG